MSHMLLPSTFGTILSLETSLKQSNCSLIFTILCKGLTQNHHHLNFIRCLHSNLFWKKFDSVALKLWKTVLSGMEQFTRAATREVVRFVSERNSPNLTSVNHVNDLWENIHKEFEKLDLNTIAMKTVEDLQTYFSQDYKQKDAPKVFGQLRDVMGMLIKSDCGNNLVLECLREVGIVQYLDNTRQNSTMMMTTTTERSSTARTLTRQPSLDIAQVFGADIELIMDWTAFCVIYVGNQYNLW